uniref:Uncharacterized protein n=1 Tax=Panagrolaimus sp. PS1159 TaxID=55785 RepID=A0AC35FH20_9BILA
MVVHVGVTLTEGELYYFDENEQRTDQMNIMKVTPDEPEKLNSVFEEIKTKTNGKQLGYLCFTVYSAYSNDMRKQLIEEGLKYGFKNVEMINNSEALYIYTMSQIKHVLSNGEIIWIHGCNNDDHLSYFQVWEIIDHKGVFIGCWGANSSKLSDLKFVVKASQLGKGPNIVLYSEKIDTSRFNIVFPDCQVLMITKENSDSKGSLVKARISAGDNRLAQLDALNHTTDDITLKLIQNSQLNRKRKNRMIKSYECGQQLPLFFSQKIKKTNFGTLEVASWSECLNGFVTPETVAADLLQYIKCKAEEFQGKPLTNVVITVPAAFNEAQKNATLEAAKIAGCEKVELLPEPIAAAFAYFHDRPISNNSKVLVFDLGGGTLDVCIFNIKNGKIHILSNTGDSKFGGRDFDTVLNYHFKNILYTKYGISVADSKKYLLMTKCEEIKEMLSECNSANLDIDYFDGNQDGFIPITREEFEKMTELLLNKVRNTIQSALYHSKYTANQINKILQVGGGSRMPMMKNLLYKIFPNAKHCCEVHPDEVVAIGAAHFARNTF